LKNKYTPIKKINPPLKKLEADTITLLY